MTRLFNTTGSLVTDALDGMLPLAGAAHLARLDGYPHTKVVLRSQPDPSKVAVISGGGSGHEPAHAGFVGTGMLTAAVAGEVFASPSVDAVLAAILAASGEAGCLLVVKNYTGDRLNFGLAAERARQLGHRVEMVVVSDDIALPDAPQPRGIAGTLLVHKIAGHLAEQGADLATVAEIATTVARATRSIGLALATCDLPGQPPRSADSRPELGLGIHGEPGAEIFQPGSARDAVAALVSRLERDDPMPDSPLAVLINNLGSVTPLEMGVVAREVLHSSLGARARLIIGPAPLMTSLNMHGFSLSTLPLTGELESALTAPAGPAAWPGAVAVGQTTVRPLPDGGSGPSFPVSIEPRASALVRAVCTALIDAETELNTLDARVGDGDTGSTFGDGARAVMAALDDPGLPLATPAHLLCALGRMLGSRMGGSSGVLMSILFTRAGNTVAEGGSPVAGLLAGTDAIQHYGGARPGDRTLLDALTPALERLQAGGSLADAAAAARAGAQATGRMRRAGAGRSAYLRAESLAGTPDPGAVAIARAFEAAAAL